MKDIAVVQTSERHIYLCSASAKRFLAGRLSRPALQATRWHLDHGNIAVLVIGWFDGVLRTPAFFIGGQSERPVATVMKSLLAVEDTKDDRSFRQRCRLDLLKIRRVLGREIRPSRLLKCVGRQPTARRRGHFRGSILLQLSLHAWRRRGLHRDRNSHRGYSAHRSGGPTCARHPDQHGLAAHDRDVRWTNTRQSISDPRLRHISHEDSRRAENEWAAYVRNDARNHRTDVHVSDARGGHHAD